MDDLVGSILGQYKIVEPLGAGGMAVVYRAYQLSVERDVAIKVMDSRLSNGPQFAERFRREAKTMASLNHPHIIKVFDFAQQDDLAYIVMELQSGGVLTDLIQPGPLPIADVIRLFEQLASAIDYAHKKGVIHRDLKPQNMLLDHNKNVYITDFGIGKLINESQILTQTGTAMGTPLYMSPEQWAGGNLDSRTDLYSLGIVLFEMLTGQVPFQGDTPYSTMHKLMNAQLPALSTFRSDLPAQLDLLFDKALAKDRDQRFASAHEMLVALKRDLEESVPEETLIEKTVDFIRDRPSAPISLLDNLPTVHLPTSPQGKPIRRSPNRLIGIVVAGLLAAVVILLFFVIRGSTQTVTSTPSAIATIVVSAPTTAPAIIVSPTIAVVALDIRSATATVTNTLITTSPTLAFTSTPSTIPNTPTDTPFPTSTPTATTGVDTLVARTVMAFQTQTANAIASFTATPTETYTPSPDLSQTAAALIQIIRVTNTANAMLTLTKSVTPTRTATAIPTATQAGSSGKIAFSSNRDKNFQIYVMNADGSNQINISRNQSNDLRPAWSPDGTRIAFQTDRDGHPQIYVMNADGSNPVNVNPNKFNDFEPLWSPDGTQIVFESEHNGSYQIWVMNADGSRPTNLSRNQFADGDPVWSPDGKHIAFTSKRDVNQEIYVMNADGSNQTNLTHNPAEDFWPGWSPDSKHILFTSTRDKRQQVYVMDSDGRNQVNLTQNKSDCLTAAWSSDGKYIVYDSIQDGTHQIYVMQADGSNQTDISHASGNNILPVWR